MKKLLIMMLSMCCFGTMHSMWQSNKTSKGPKVLHLGFHHGCLKDFEEISKYLDINLTSWYLLSSDLPRTFFDGCDCGNQIYNITANRAERIWDLHKNFFDQFDIIVTSDTAPLARIFLQNDWQKPLVVWVCNRFDYCHYPTTEPFPDKAYYDLMNKARNKSNVSIISYTDFERVYAHTRGVDLGNRTIRPIGSLEDTMRDGTHNSAIPDSIVLNDTLFLYPRFDTSEQIGFIQNECKKLGIATYHGAYNGPNDLMNFKGVLYFPYQWSNLALFENIQRGIIHFVPTAQFLRKLIEQGYPIRDATRGIVNGPYHYCEWYQEQYKDIFVYFDSWQDLQGKIQSTDYEQLRTSIKKFAATLRNQGIVAWQQLFKEVVEVI